MRLSAMVAGSTAQGMTTENGNVVGEITLGGTVALILFGGVFAGLFGGLLYAALRPWLEPLGRWRGLIFGVGVLGLGGSLILDADNSDFIVLRPPVFNVAAFALLFPIFGMVLAPTFDGVLRLLARGPRTSGVAALLASLFAALFLGLGLVSGLSALASGPTTADLVGLMLLGMTIAGLAVRALAPRAMASPSWMRATYALLAGAVFVGAARTLANVVRIIT
ncbi:MAG TPA: hypothetical protein VGR87_01570 [Candidatus Limnocylindria bacterium]|jgi:hypothetical protein|nr:hypothetical protein [Candidatus Limnocylindria bacterium]